MSGRGKQSMKCWVPRVDVQGDPSEYQNVLDASLRNKPPQTFDDMDVILRDAGEVSGASIKKSRICKPWKSDELKLLLVRRRTSQSQIERNKFRKKSKKYPGSYYVNTEIKTIREFWRISKIWEGYQISIVIQLKLH